AINYYLDKADYYEINPQMVDIAKNYFTYMKKGNYSIIEGDGRIKIRETKEKYDLIILDAFSGDNIPLHLLTKEAFQDYVNKLNDNGEMLIHITNNYINLLPYLKEVSGINGWKIISYEGKKEGFQLDNHWVYIRV